MARLGLHPGAPVALAVSGGGDSVALMRLAAEWAGRSGNVTVLTVDHGLRSGSRKEAALVREWAKAAGLPAQVLRWSGKKPKANLEEKARAARYRLLGDWCRAHGVAALLVAHTREDQAETFLLRLGRGSGVDGLSAMRAKAPLPVAGFDSVALYRPLLDFGRAELRADLAARSIPWLEDPMNEDPRFARVRVRALLPQLEQAGVSPARVAAAAAHLARAREALDGATAEFLAAHVRFGSSGLSLIDGAALGRLHPEIGLRVLSAVLMRVSGATYRPRFERLNRLFSALRAGDFPARTLQGCRIGKAPKAHAGFGPSTLEIQAEKPRRSATPKAKRRKVTKPAPKPPHKKRNLGLSLNS